MQTLDNKTANKFTQFIFHETDQLISKEIETKRQYELMVDRYYQKKANGANPNFIKDNILNL